MSTSTACATNHAPSRWTLAVKQDGPAPLPRGLFLDVGYERCPPSGVLSTTIIALVYLPVPQLKPKAPTEHPCLTVERAFARVVRTLRTDVLAMVNTSPRSLWTFYSPEPRWRFLGGPFAPCFRGAARGAGVGCIALWVCGWPCGSHGRYRPFEATCVRSWSAWNPSPRGARGWRAALPSPSWICARSCAHPGSSPCA